MWNTQIIILIQLTTINILWPIIYLVPVCSGFPEVRILPPSSGIQQSLWGKSLVYEALVIPFITPSHGMLRRGLQEECASISEHWDRKPLGQCRNYLSSLTLPTHYLTVWRFSSWRWMSHAFLTSTIKIWKSCDGHYSQNRVPELRWRQGGISPPSIFGCPGSMLAAVAHTQVHLSLSLSFCPLSYFWHRIWCRVLSPGLV